MCSLASATQSIRTFGKSVDVWLRAALVALPERLKTIKLTIINAFAMTLRRYTSLNHLAQAARAVLLNSTQVNQMLADLNKVDFHNVQVCLSLFCSLFCCCKRVFRNKRGGSVNVMISWLFALNGNSRVICPVSRHWKIGLNGWMSSWLIFSKVLLISLRRNTPNKRNRFFSIGLSTVRWSFEI